MIPALQIALEEKLELEELLWGMDILVRSGSAHGRFMHADTLSHISQHHRFQLGHSMLQEIMLKFEDALGHPVKSLLSLLNTLDQPCSCSYLFLEILAGFLLLLSFLARHATVEGTDPKARDSFFVEKHHVFIADLLHGDIRDDRADFFLIETSRRFRFQRSDELRSRDDLLNRDAQFSGQFLVTSGLQLTQMTRNEPRGQTAVELEVLQLNQETFFEVTSCDTYRIKELDLFQDSFRVFWRCAGGLTELFEREREITIGI